MTDAGQPLIADSPIEWLPARPGGVMALAQYDTAGAPIGAVLPSDLAQAHPRRQAEYIAGRSLVARCAARLGHPPFDLPKGPDGPPLWPPGLSGTISHSHGRVAVALLPGQALLGLDIEQIATARKCAAIQKIALTKDEAAWIAERPAADLPRLLTTLFSAKEAFYKTVWPLVQRKFGFACATIAPFDPSDRHLMLQATPEIAKSCPAEHWRVDLGHGEDYVLTSIGIQDS